MGIPPDIRVACRNPPGKYSRFCVSGSSGRERGSAIEKCRECHNEHRKEFIQCSHDSLL
ncbi:hypothetical protein [Methanogenium organophilum]|uniref:Uncharacterized protein n=1 Tax=Methanogenium organophilum TaxID=2199 RepID=A0A9X9S5U0_METOG|nr:hypothetical protein [Methanogenium organophilum]WAI02221.1 hypothetical protein OU421_04945 [Methanogenium organophilum]